MKHLLFTLLVLSLIACSKSDEVPSIKISNVVVQSLNNIQVRVTYHVNLSGKPTIIEKGLICSVDADASILNARIPENSSNEQEQKEIVVTVNSPNSTFYIRPYVITNTDTILGEIKTFQSGLLYQTGTVTDIDGNNYQTTKIGTQHWMAENLNTNRYRNGDTIPAVANFSELTDSQEGVWFHNNFDNQNLSIYAKRYTELVIEDSRNVCPTGWRIPTESDLVVLRNYLGNNDFFAGKLKTTGNLTEATGVWKYPNYRATNDSGLSILPGGLHDYQGNNFSYIGELGGFIYRSNDGDLKVFTASYNSGNFEIYISTPKSGQFIRCIKE